MKNGSRAADELNEPKLKKKQHSATHVLSTVYVTVVTAQPNGSEILFRHVLAFDIGIDTIDDGEENSEWRGRENSGSLSNRGSGDMNPARAMLKLVSVIRWAEMIRSLRISMVMAAVAMAVALGAPSPCSAQTLNLGQAGADGFFAVANTNTGGGDFNFSNSTDLGGAMLGAGTYLGGSGTIVGSLSSDPTAQYSGVNVLGGTSVNSGLAGLGQTAINVANTAAGWSTSGANVLSNQGNGNSYVFNGSSSNSGNNVITINSTTNSGLLNLNSGNYTITLNGTSNEQFVFNITGRTTWTNVHVILNGVSASNVFYNFISGNDGINNSTLWGTVLNVINGTSMSIDNSTIAGAVVSDGFVDLANSTIAPELPTIMMAGIACLFLLGKAGLDCRRRLTARTACPQA